MSDEIDRAQELTERHLQDSLAAHREKTTEEAGDGTCEDCGDTISEKRLAALPTARASSVCQKKHEQRGR